MRFYRKRTVTVTFVEKWKISATKLYKNSKLKKAKKLSKF